MFNLSGPWEIGVLVWNTETRGPKTGPGPSWRHLHCLLQEGPGWEPQPLLLPPGGGSWLRRAAHPLPSTGWFGWSTPGCPLGAQTTPQQRHPTPGLGSSLYEAGRPAESLALSLGNGCWGEGMPTQNLPVLPDPVWENQVCPHHQGWVVWERPGKHSRPHDQVPLSGKRRCLQPFLWAGGRVRGTRRQEAPGSPAWSAGWAHLSPALGSRGPASLSSHPHPPPRSMGATCRAVGMADPCVGHISAPPRLPEEAFPGHPDHRAPLTCCPLPGQPLSFSQEAEAGSPGCPVLSTQGRTGWRRPLQ